MQLKAGSLASVLLHGFQDVESTREVILVVPARTDRFSAREMNNLPGHAVSESFSHCEKNDMEKNAIVMYSSPITLQFPAYILNRPNTGCQSTDLFLERLLASCWIGQTWSNTIQEPSQ